MNHDSNIYLKYFIKIVLCCLVLFVGQPCVVFAQTVAPKDSMNVKDSSIILSADSLTISSPDSLKNTTGLETTPSDSVSAKEKQLGIRISRDALPAIVTTTAKDSAVLNVKDKVFYLYGDAKADYDDLEIKSGILVFHQKDDMLWAQPILDTSNKITSTQEFKQGDQTFTYDTLKYNFKSKRAIVRNAHSQYGEGFVISQQIKRNADGSIFGYKSIYTTCDLDHPHFGIQAKRIKVIPNKVIASGPANLQVMDIPTPLFFPFGMFPITQGQHSGFILPAYNLDVTRGLGLQNGGYYFAINDHVGWTTYLDVFSTGSWATRNAVQYASRYHYSGNFNINYSYTNNSSSSFEAAQPSRKDFNVTWSHSVDAKATPNSSFSASVNFGTSSYNSINQIDALSKIQNTYASSISWSKTWQNKPYSLAIAARHSQTTNTGALSITLPSINFNLGQFSPFQRKEMIGNPRWYEKITVGYSVNAVNNYNTYDSLFGKNGIAFTDMDNAIKHDVSISATYSVLRFFNLNFSVPYSEYWNTKRVYRYRNPNDLNQVDSFRQTGFFATRQASVTSSFSTRIYGMKLFKKGKIAGIRHVMTPTVGVSYVPGMAHAPFNYYYQNVDLNGYPTYNNSPYDGAPLGGPSGGADPSGSITFGLGNTLQMKVRTTDTTGNASTKNISLIDNFSISGNYNMFADSNNLSIISTSFSTNILNKINISASGSFTPYKYINGRPSRYYLLGQGEGLAKLNNAGINFSMSFKGEKKNQAEQEDAMKNNENVNSLLSNGRYQEYNDFSIPWDLSVSGGLTFNRVYDSKSNTDSIVTSPNLIVRGGFNLTERWKVSADFPLVFVQFQKVSIGAANINISRDLHCWQMSLNLIPFGYYRSFFFTLNVKSSVLQDLKLTKRNYSSAY